MSAAFFVRCCRPMKTLICSISRFLSTYACAFISHTVRKKRKEKRDDREPACRSFSRHKKARSTNADLRVERYRLSTRTAHGCNISIDGVVRLPSTAVFRETGNRRRRSRRQTQNRFRLKNSRRIAVPPKMAPPIKSVPTSTLLICIQHTVFLGGAGNTKIWRFFWRFAIWRYFWSFLLTSTLVWGSVEAASSPPYGRNITGPAAVAWMFEEYSYTYVLESMSDAP